MQYYVNEAAFALPARPFVDRTLHRLTASLPGSEGGVSVEIRRVPIPADRTLRQVVEEGRFAEHAKHTGFTVVSTVEAALDGAPALLVRARLRAQDYVHLLFQAHVAVEGTWLAFVVTGPSARRSECESIFDRLVAGLRWRKR